MAIVIDKLCKSFRVPRKSAGFAASVRNLFNPQYSDVPAVDNISFSVARGESIAFIGPNGAGKSTTIKMLTGILYPDSGHALVNSVVPWEHRLALTRSIGAVFGQKSQLWIHLPPVDTFSLLSGIYELDPAQYRAHLAELVEIFDITGFMDVPVRKLSLGQRMRCEIVAALIHKPQILFLDEPTIGLDVVARQKIRKLLCELNRQKGVTVFLTSHDAGDIEEVCRRVIIVNSGRIITDQKVDVLKRNFMSTKIVSLKLEKDAELPSMEGVTILKRKNTGLKLEVDTSKAPIGRVLDLVMERCGIADLNIAPPPLEDIISRIYTARSDG